MDLLALIQECTPARVPHETMQAVMKIESTFDPYAIGYKIVRKSDRQVFELNKRPRDKKEAIGWAKWLQRNGYVFDAGAAQVNSSNFKRYGLTIESAFDPCQSIRVGSLILAECYDRARRRERDKQVAVRAAISCYNSGNFSTGFRTGYVQKVVAAALTKGARK